MKHRLYFSGSIAGLLLLTAYFGLALIQPVQAHDSTTCHNWFRNTEISPSDPECVPLCNGASVGLGTFSCKSPGLCEHYCTVLPVYKDDPCHEDKKTGNPCNPATGGKVQREHDVNGRLGLTRNYNSLKLNDVGFGKGWQSQYHKRLNYFATGHIIIEEPTGRSEMIRENAGIWQGDADTDYALTENPDGSLTLELPNGHIEQYASTGRLLKLIDAQGDETILTYTGTELTSVTDEFGQSITFAYDNDGHITSVTDASGAEYRYEYDANDNLTAVIYPDLTPANSNDNPKRIYHYELATFPNHLTGITDANGQRYATFGYDGSGRATSTEHAQTTNAVGQERYQLSY